MLHLIKKLSLTALMLAFVLTSFVYANCENPKNLQTIISGNQITFSWSGTQDHDIYAILLWDNNKQQNSNAFTSIGSSFSTTSIQNGNYKWRIKAICNLTDTSEWVWGNDFIFAGQCPPPSTANAGLDKLNLSGTNVSLSANNPAIGTGTWSIVSGIGGNINSPYSNISNFEGIAGNTYTLRWTVSNTCGSNYDDVIISFQEACPQVPPINIGPDLSVRSTATILAPKPSGMITTHYWEVKKDGMFIQNSSSNPLILHGTIGDYYQVTCYVTNGCSTSSDDINIVFCPDQVNAGVNQIVCGSTTSLSAIGVGSWTILSGDGGSLGDPTSASSTFTGTIGTEYALQWGGTDNCGSNYDTVLVTFNSPPIQPEVSGKGCLPTGEYMLSGKVNPGEIGTWSVTQGDGGIFSNIHDPESAFIAQANQTYIVRWTVSNDCGSAYKELTNIKKKKINNPHLNSNLEYGTVTDIDCNEYPTIQIGSQTWMAENLRTSRLNDNSYSIPYAAFSEINSENLAVAYHAIYGTQILNYWSDTAYGMLYNWGAARNPKLCPKGWRVPSQEDFLFIQNLAETLKSTSGWDIADPRVNNESGFSAIPSGRRTSNTIGYNGGGTFAYYWTNSIIPTGLNEYSALGQLINSNLSGNPFNGIPTPFNYLLACRCIKDDCKKTPTANAGADKLNIIGTSASLNADNPSYGTGQWTIISGEGGSIRNNFPLNSMNYLDGKAGETYLLQWTVSGACASASDTMMVSFCPSISTADAGTDQLNIIGTSTLLNASSVEHGSGSWSIISGAGGFINSPQNPQSSFIGTEGNTYVLRWTVSTSCTSNYDDVSISFEKFLNPDLNYGTVTDIDGNSYATIQIGNQIWMAENLKTTQYNDGTSIPNITLDSQWAALSTGAWCYYNNDSTKNNPYGKMYNWYSTITGKLCPLGWRIPTQSDFEQLASYLSPGTGGKLKSIAGWMSPNTGADNSTGFAGLPGGTRDANGVFSGLGNLGSWWTNTDLDGVNAWLRQLKYNKDTFSNNGLNHKRAHSCRCIKE
ncbi:MAG: fibrobacter succinogenes major paralogous domain-containing protein [Chitinophagales bacterium]|nr:fibrobacter succinogenes major paralogous domain-containing protein [Chitinophagales bacterium]